MPNNNGHVPDTVTPRELYQAIATVTDRINRLEKVVIALAVIVASPKLGGPQISDITGAFLHLFGG